MFTVEHIHKCTETRAPRIVKIRISMRREVCTSLTNIGAIPTKFSHQHLAGLVQGRISLFL